MPQQREPMPWEDAVTTAPATTGYKVEGIPGTEPKIPLGPVQAPAQSARQPMPWEDAVTQPAAATPTTRTTTTPYTPPEPSPLYKAGHAFVEGLGLPTLYDIIGGASRDPKRIEKSKQALQAVLQGIANEPGRVWGEVTNLGQALIDPKQNTADVAYHMAGAVPFFGAPTQQIAQDIARGDPAAAVGHTGALVAPFLLGPAVGAAGRGAATAGRVATGALRGTIEAIPSAIGEGLSKAPYGAGGGLPGMVTAAKVAAGKELLKGAVKGGRAALSARAAAVAEQLAKEQAAAAAAREAADAALKEQAGIYETHERMTQPPRQLGAGPVTPPPPADTSFVRSVPAEYPTAARTVIPESRQLAAGPPQVFELPPATDTSFVRSVPAEYPEVIKPEMSAPAPPAAAPLVTMDELSKGLTGKTLSRLNAAEREQVQAVYDRIQHPLPAEAPTPAQQAIITPADQATAQFEVSAEDLKPQEPAPDLTQQLQASIDQAQAAKQTPAQPFDFATAPRAAKVDKLVQTLRDHGMGYGDASIMDPADWRKLAQVAGVNEPSGTTIRDALVRMRELDAQAPPPAPATPPAPPQAPPAPTGAAGVSTQAVQSMLDAIPNVKHRLVKTFGPVEWETVEELAGLRPQSEATRKAVLDAVQAREAKVTPAQAREAFAQARGKVSDLQTWYHGTKKQFDTLDPAFSHPGSEHGEAVYITDRHPEASKYGPVREVQFTGQVFPEHAALDRTLMNKVIKQLIADHPDQAQAIKDGVARSKQLGVKTNDIALQEIARALPGDFRMRQNAVNAALKKLGYAARSYVEETGAKTLAVFDRDALKSK